MRAAARGQTRVHALIVGVLLEAERADPLTMIYLALPGQGDVTRAALLIDRLPQRTGVFSAPIAYRCLLAAESFDFLDQPVPALASGAGFVRMSVPADQVAQSVLGVAAMDELAIRVHEAYRATAQASEDADKPRATLADTYKRANSRTLEHLPAKLWTAGVRPESLPALTGANRTQIDALIASPNDDPLLLKLAELEHIRWCTARKLDGWTAGPVRETLPRIRDRLIPFDAPSPIPGEVENDIDHVREVLRIVAGSG